jgi:hypothetical protein
MSSELPLHYIHGDNRDIRQTEKAKAEYFLFRWGWHVLTVSLIVKENSSILTLLNRLLPHACQATVLLLFVPLLGPDNTRADHHHKPITPGMGRGGVTMDELISHKILHCSLYSAMRISLGMLHFVHSLMLPDTTYVVRLIVVKGIDYSRNPCMVLCRLQIVNREILNLSSPSQKFIFAV